MITEKLEIIGMIKIPRRIKKVKCERHGDCCMACVAMVTNQKLKDVKRFVRRNRLISSKLDYGAYPQEVYKILNKMGVNCRFVKYNGLKNLQTHAILVVTPFDDHTPDNHAIVWDAVRQSIVDPSGSINKRLLFHNVYVCIEIVRKHDD